MMTTRLTELLGIHYPIIQGGMAWISESKMVSAVSNAGGAGIIASGGRTTEWMRNEIRQTRKMTDKPFGVNLMLMNPNKDEIADLVIAESVPFVTTGAGNPVPYIEKLKAAGVIVIPVVPNLKAALKAEAAGADAIVIEGTEAGGHVGTLSSIALMTNIIPKISIPVIAAGGFVDGRGLVAALAMGAEGVQMGSVFLVTRECDTHEKAKNAIIQATDTDSIVTGYGTRHAVRGLQNAFSDKYFALLAKGVPQSELDDLATGTNQLAAQKGDVDNGFVLVGSSVVPLMQVLTIKETIDHIIDEAKSSLHKIASIKL